MVASAQAQYALRNALSASAFFLGFLYFLCLLYYLYFYLLRLYPLYQNSHYKK